MLPVGVWMFLLSTTYTLTRWNATRRGMDVSEMKKLVDSALLCYPEGYGCFSSQGVQHHERQMLPVGVWMFQMDTVNNTKYVLTVINLNNSTR